MWFLEEILHSARLGNFDVALLGAVWAVTMPRAGSMLSGHFVWSVGSG